MAEIAYIEKTDKEFGAIKSYRLPKSRDSEKIEDKYSKKYILTYLMEKQPIGRALFYFNDRSEYITLTLSGQLNVRGQEDMFRAWGSSEFRNLQPQTLFKELENEITKIEVISASGAINYSFNSYGDFISWLAGEAVKR